MARIRTVKPAFFKSQSIANLDKLTRLTFIGLWTYADDEGRGVDDPRLIKAEVWPLDDDYTARKVEKDLVALHNAERTDTDLGLIDRYEVAGRRYFWIPKFNVHQRISHPQPSILPPPEPSGPERERSAPVPETFRNDAGTFRQSVPLKGSGSGREVDTPPRSGAHTNGAGDPLTAAEPPEVEHESGEPNPLAVRWHGIVKTNNRRARYADSLNAVEHCRQYLAGPIVDEVIGYCATLSDPPRTANYLVKACRTKAAECGIDLPDMPKADA